MFLGYIFWWIFATILGIIGGAFFSLVTNLIIFSFFGVIYVLACRKKVEKMVSVMRIGFFFWLIMLITFGLGRLLL